MNTIASVGESGSRHPPQTFVHLGSLDLRGVRARVECVDDDLVLLVDDGDVEVEFSSGMSGRWEQAIAGTEQLAATAAAYAQELRRRGSAHRARAFRTDPAA